MTKGVPYRICSVCVLKYSGTTNRGVGLKLIWLSSENFSNCSLSTCASAHLDDFGGSFDSTPDGTLFILSLFLKNLKNVSFEHISKSILSHLCTEPRSDHSLPMSVTNSLINWLTTMLKLEGFDPCWFGYLSHIDGYVESTLLMLKFSWGWD